MSVKIANTTYPVLDLLKNRWSARSFSDKEITTDQLHTIVEAASWMFSASNEQPWRFIVGKKETDIFDQILDTLAPGNAVWAKNAGAFIVSIVKTTFEKEGNPENAWAEHDLGAANAGLILQALSMDIYAHPMAGFDAAKLSDTFKLSTGLKPLVVVALGYLDSADKLGDPFKERELTPRIRKPLEELIIIK